jgi:reverse gyrase
VDTTHDTAVLRSDAPTVKGGVAGYYEVVLKGTDQASVSRYAVDRAAGTPREQVPFALTHEAIAKLADDIAG